MSSVNTVNQNEMIPLNFQLSQNYPNPFKNWTMIKYCLPVRSNVGLTILNSQGEIVKQLINQIQKAGTYEIKFEAYDFLEGEYNYILKADGFSFGFQKSFTAKKKMALIK